MKYATFRYDTVEAENRPQLHDTGLLSERNQILVFQGVFRT